MIASLAEHLGWKSLTVFIFFFRNVVVKEEQSFKWTAQHNIKINEQVHTRNRLLCICYLDVVDEEHKRAHHVTQATATNEKNSYFDYA